MEKCKVYGGEFIIDRKGLTIGRTFSRLQTTRYSGLINVAPMKFLKLVKSKRFNTRVASFQSQFLAFVMAYSQSTQQWTLRQDLSEMVSTLISMLNLKSHYVDNTAKSSGVNVGEYLKDSQGSIIRRSYYTYGEYKCVKFKNQTVVRDQRGQRKSLS